MKIGYNKAMLVRETKERGFSLIEVLMAMTLFSFFIAAFMLSQGYNITSSSKMREDLQMHTLANRVIREKILNPPRFSNATENEIETKKFEEEAINYYQYTIEYKKIILPDLSAMIPENQLNQNSSEQALQKKVFDKLKENVELMLWQIKVKVENTQTKQFVEQATWITNAEAKVDLNFGI